jgi:hypothetical protein
MKMKTSIVARGRLVGEILVRRRRSAGGQALLHYE